MLDCNRQDPKAGAGVSDEMKQTTNKHHCSPQVIAQDQPVDLGQTEMQKPGNNNAEPLTHHLTSLQTNPQLESKSSVLRCLLQQKI